MKYREIKLLIAEEEIIRLCEAESKACIADCIEECIEDGLIFTADVLSVSNTGSFDFCSHTFTPGVETV